jgi:hypothetical protein
MVGPKPRISVQQRRAPVVGRRGVDDDVLLVEQLGQAAVSMKAGTWVVNFSTVFGLPPGGVYVAFFFELPSIVCSVEEISCTLPLRTWSRKNGW